jgi:hypothetical protein
VLDPDVVWTSDGGGRANAAREPLRGGARVARIDAIRNPEKLRRLYTHARLAQDA